MALRNSMEEAKRASPASYGSEKGVSGSDSRDSSISGKHDGVVPRTSAPVNPRRFADKSKWARFALFEWTSIEPVQPEDQVQTNYLSVAALWFSANVNVLTFSTGMLAPSMGLSLMASLWTILAFVLACSIAPAYFVTFGPKFGLRQIVQSRYSFGYFGASVVALLCAASLIAYCIINSILGGTTLTAVSSNGSLSPTVGIVIIAVLSFAVSFCGYRVLHFIESFIWFPTLICFILLTAFAGTGANGLHRDADEPKTSARAVLAMGCTIAGFQLSWAGAASDVSLYMYRDIDPKKLFIPVYLAFTLSVTPLMMLGAAFASSAQHIPSWHHAMQEMDESNAPGPLFVLILAGRTGNFGKFLTVLLSLSAMGNIMTSIYSFGINCQTMLPFLTVFPRFIFSIVALAIFLPLAIVVSHKQTILETLNDFVSVIAYWSALYVGVVAADHCVMRRCRYDSYDLSAWNDWNRLPPGFAGLGSAILALGLVIPCMDQSWYSGPLAKHSGDLGFEVGLVLSFVLYCILRPIERRLFH